MRTLSRVPFDPREVRVVSDLARWMGLLGRFQIVAATFIFLLLLAAAALVTTAEVLEPAAGAAADEQPLVSIGEVSRGTIAAVVAVVVGFSLVFLRGGMLLISAAEDLETVAARTSARATSSTRPSAASAPTSCSRRCSWPPWRPGCTPPPSSSRACDVSDEARSTPELKIDDEGRPSGLPDQKSAARLKTPLPEEPAGARRDETPSHLRVLRPPGRDAEVPPAPRRPPRSGRPGSSR
ncbi:MAG: hypothetical protein M5U28_35240 [Sandaracinaceae bacterium]|nr:hypothetical protein [Sandaracinaceae bacterium]